MMISTCCNEDIEVICCVGGDYYTCIKCGRVTKVKSVLTFGEKENVKLTELLPITKVDRE